MSNKLVLSSTVSFDQINKAVTNTSTSKQTFSFSKNQRFVEPKPSCPEVAYGGDSILKKNAGTGIGYGTRYDFTKCLNVSPSSHKYRLRTFCEDNADRNKGIKFAQSRDKVIFSNYVPKQQLKVPSPAFYEKNGKLTQRSAPKYSVGQKTTLVDKKLTFESQNNNPGPGTYENPQLSHQFSLNFISKFQNVVYTQPRSKRFFTSQTVAPGPGKYEDITMMSKKGNYVLSQNRGGTKGKFDAQKRQSPFQKTYKKEVNNPGPGSYQSPSQFGQYDGDIYNQLRTQRKVNTGWPQISGKKQPQK